MNAQRMQRLAQAMARRQDQLERLEHARADYWDAVWQDLAAGPGVVAASQRIFERYPEFVLELLEGVVELFVEVDANPADGAEHAPPAQGLRQVSSGMLPLPHTLATLRELRKVSRAQLARQSGLGEDVFAALEEGRVAFPSVHAVPDELLVELAIALRVEAALLITLSPFAGPAHPEARAFADVVRESEQTAEPRKVRWLALAERTSRAHGDLDGEIDD
jgi:transcriptional regulator with XRE-family HTH domain